MRRAQDRARGPEKTERAQTCERSELRAMRMCPPSGQIFLYKVCDSIN